MPDAVVQEAEIDRTGIDYKAKYNQSDAGQDTYTDYVIRNQYLKDGHTYQMGLSSPQTFKNASCAFVQLAAPTLIWIADWTAARSLLPPEIPSPQFLVNLLRTTSARNIYLEQWTLLDESLDTAGIVELDADGQIPTYRISGIYIYGCGNPQSELVKHIVFGLAPYIDQDGTIFRRVPNRSFLNADIIYSP